MSRTETAALLARGIKAMGLRVEAAQQERFCRYCRELDKWNRSINLVARNTPRTELIERHFLDSLALLALVDRLGPGLSLVDVGTGAGFPGLVLAVARPDRPVILLEPRQKRVSFLRHMVRTLAITNAGIKPGRLEDFPDLPDQRPGLVTCRALMEPERFLALCAPFLDRSARVLLMLARGPDLALPPHLTLEEEIRYILPFSGLERVLCLVGPVNT